MRKILFAMIMLAMLVACASGLSLTFQDPGEFTNYVTCYQFVPGGSGICAYTQSPNGGNSYIYTERNGGQDAAVINSDPLLMTYAAFTAIDGNSLNLVEFDNEYNIIAAHSIVTPGAGSRIEVKIVGGQSQAYVNGASRGAPISVSINPSYVGAYSSGIVSVDDYVFGTTENKNIFGSPEPGFFIKKDLLNPAASGFCFPNGTVISSYNMTTTWGVGDNNASHTIQLKEWSGGDIAGTYVTTPGTMAGSIAWPIYDDIINNPAAPYGYYVTTIAGSGSVSEVIPYISTGASVAFDQTTYARGDTATISYSVDGGGYWDTALYNYRLDTLDVYGNVINTQSVTTQSGSKSVTFTASDPLGIYYAVLIATPTAGGSDIWMNYDYAELTGYIVFTGSVYNAETALPIPVSNVSIVQDSIVFNKVTSVDGNYTTNSAFTSGSTISVNITASGYQQYTNSFIPLEAKTIGLNFTLIPTSPSITGVALGGVDVDSVYGRPIASASVDVTNSTYSESYSNVTNSVGYYIVNGLTANRCYSVVATKSGYSTASYFRCVVSI